MIFPTNFHRYLVTDFNILSSEPAELVFSKDKVTDKFTRGAYVQYTSIHVKYITNQRSLNTCLEEKYKQLEGSWMFMLQQWRMITFACKVTVQLPCNLEGHNLPTYYMSC